jgi:lipopolysaccharide export system permease protein
MIAAGIIGRYFALRFLQAVAIVMLAVVGIALMLDLFEGLRKAGDRDDIAVSTLMALSILKLPFILEEVFPFAILFGSMAAFLMLSRRLELVIARSAGISAWQFIAPSIIAALLLGIVSIAAFNPVVAVTRDRAEAIDEELFGNRSNANRKGFWFRQSHDGRDSVVRADRLRGARISNPTFFRFNPDGSFSERVEAKSAELKNGEWHIARATVYTADASPAVQANYVIGTGITRSDLAALEDDSPYASIWTLPGTIDRLELAGLPSTPYRLQQQSLFAKPLFFVAMVLVAASVSLRFFRIGGVARMVGLGILGGFALFIVNRITQDLGSAGFMSPLIAAWLAPVVGALSAIYVLLRLEDG